MKFRVINFRPLDSGGYGDVFVGQRSDTGEYVVKKILREWRLQHAKEGFEREVHVLGRGVPGLVTLLDSDLAAQPPYYVMPYLEGGKLTKHAGRLTDNQLQNIAAELAWALANLHAAFEVHGDVKPDNVLVSRDGGLRIADPLGNGTLFTILFRGNRGGTPGYCAPEIAAGGPISRAGDVYSYCVTLHHLLTGCQPVAGQRLSLSPTDFARSPKICEIITAGWTLEPQSRPTMQDVLQMLRGQRWTEIQAERKQRQETLAAVLFGGSLVALLLSLASGRRRG
jgi:eukaryotic-like serine/threonine-protein kinase